MFWLELLRVRTLPLAVCAIVVGNALAHQAGMFDAKRFIFTLFTAILLQILCNIANDYGDGMRGTDSRRPESSPQRFAHRPEYRRKVQSALWVCGGLTLVSGLILLKLIPEHLRIVFVLLGILSMAAALLYTLGKKPYGYQGFGELAVLIFFGWLAVMGSYVVQTEYLDFKIFLPATGVGLLSVAVLMINNARDIELDRAAHKNTLAVQLGLTQYLQRYRRVMQSALGCFVIFCYFLPQSWLVLLMIYPILRQIQQTEQSALAGKIARELPCHVRLVVLTTFLFIINLLR